MPRDKSDVIAGLKKKGFESTKNTHHQYYAYRMIDGRISDVFTYTSHSGKELSDSLLSKMARQCKLKREEFLKLIDCPMSRQEYEQDLKRKGLV
jgi:predicted RNA binding protein YcfA (HicA-like mRNA interferase family)